jgi:hypothetical protein
MNENAVFMYRNKEFLHEFGREISKEERPRSI